MNSNWNKNEDGAGVLQVVLEGDDWNKAQKKAFNAVKRNLEMKGFRKGQVPDALVRQRFSKEMIAELAAEDMAQAALEEGVKEFNLDLIDRPTLTIEEVSPEKAVLSFACQVTPDVALGDYRSIRVEKDAVNIPEEQVDEEVEKVRERFADWVLRDEEEPAQDHDQVTIDYVGTIDGEEFPGGSAENAPLELGSQTFIPGFEEQLIGIRPEEERDITVTFPEDYPADEVAGKEAVFHVKTHDIKYKELPEASDDLIRRLKQDGVETLETFRENTRKSLEARAEREADQKFTDAVIDAADELTVVQIPDVMIQYETDRMYQDQVRQIQSQLGIPAEQYLSVVGQTEKSLKDSFRPFAQKRVLTDLMLEAVADAEQIEISDADVDEQFRLLSEMYQMPEDKIRQILRTEDIRQDLRTQKALERLKEIASQAE